MLYVGTGGFRARTRCPSSARNVAAGGLSCYWAPSQKRWPMPTTEARQAWGMKMAALRAKRRAEGTTVASGASGSEISSSSNRNPAPRGNPRPAPAVKLRCQDCNGETPQSYRACSHTDCVLWPFRLGTAKRGSGSRMQAIRRYCLWCMNGQSAFVRECNNASCPLRQFRMGRKLQEATS